MSQIPSYTVSLFLLVTLGSAFLLLGAQFGGEKGQYDVVREYIIDQVDKEGAVTPSVEDKVAQVCAENGLDFSRFDFSGSTTVPVPFFEVARVEIRYLSEIENKAVEQFSTSAEPLYHDVFYVTRTGR